MRVEFIRGSLIDDSGRSVGSGSSRGFRGRRRRIHKNISPASSARPTKPPIALPAINPALDEPAGEVPVADSAEVAEVVDAEVVLVVVVELEVEIYVDSGASTHVSRYQYGAYQ